MANSKLQNGVLHMVTYNDDTYEPLRSNNFELFLPDIGKFTESGGKKISPDHFVLSVSDVTPPGVTVDTLTIQYGNAKANYAGVSSFDTSEITFNDFLGIDVARCLESWFNKVFDLKTHAIGMKKNYATTAYLIEYSPDGVVQRTWELHNCWINSFKLGTYSNEDSSIRKVTCSFVYDWFNESSKSGRVY